ncbi:MAG: DNA methyltransferase [Spirochaetota bacterium]
MALVNTARKKKQEKIESGEFWTSKQRQSHNIHYVVSYRASFKPELPAFFMREFLTRKKRTILDPFGGRGTTAIEANLLGHYAIHNDINPISIFLAKSRQTIPQKEKMEKILSSLNLKRKTAETAKDKALLHFFHKDTLNEIKNLIRLVRQDQSPEMQYIGLTALSRLHGHSRGFFSVYTFPMISVSPESQKKINQKYKHKPEYREVKSRILGKMKRDLSSPLPPFYHEFSRNNQYCNGSSTDMETVETSVADLAITSPPFLDKVDYAKDNWMKAWFLNVKEKQLKPISIFNNVPSWSDFIGDTLNESSRILKPGALFVMEVGEVKVGRSIINLDEVVIEAAEKTPFRWVKTYINAQKFTKLSNCFGVENNQKGTNTNRCVILQNKK